MERVFSKGTLRDFWIKHPDSEQYLKTWYETVTNANWESPSDIRNTYATVSIVQNQRYVFNIKGNSYRLIAKINFEKKWVFIKFIGTHAEYDKINATTI